MSNIDKRIEELKSRFTTPMDYYRPADKCYRCDEGTLIVFENAEWSGYHCSDCKFCGGCSKEIN